MNSSTFKTRVPETLALAVRIALSVGTVALATAPPSTCAGDGSEGFVLWGFRQGEEAGSSVSRAGDVNGDGFDDIIIGAPSAAVYDRALAGVGYVVFGRSDAFKATFPLGSLLPREGGDGSEGFVLQGVTEGSLTCGVVAAVGDVNGDGIDDVACNGPGGNVSNIYILFGRADGFSSRWRSAASCLPTAETGAAAPS
jgi:hypothetical protein